MVAMIGGSLICHGARGVISRPFLFCDPFAADDNNDHNNNDDDGVDSAPKSDEFNGALRADAISCRSIP